MSIDEKIYNHIYCDYKWGIASENILSESYGQIPDIDKYVEDFKDFVEEKIFPYIENGGTYAQQITSPSIFVSVKKPFFTGCKIDIIVSIRDGNISWGSHYNQDDSFFNEGGGMVVIKISVGASSCKQALSALLGNFAHELTHAYDDFMSSKRGGGIKSAMKKSNYEDRLLTMKLGNDPQRVLGKLLYILSPIERNAIVGQISSEIQNEKTSTPKDAFDAIKKTTAYSRYLLCKNGVDYLNSLDNIMDKTSVLKAYTEWIGYNKRKNKNPNKEYDARKNLTYEGFLKEINSMFRTWEHTFLNSIGKVAYTHYLKMSAPLVNESEYPFDEHDEHIRKAKMPINEGFETDRDFYLDFTELKEKI